MISVKAHILREDQRPGRLLIPPNTTKMVCVEWPKGLFYLQEMRFEAYVARDLAKRSLFLINVEPVTEPTNYGQPLIYNGGWENQWIEHGDTVVNIYEFKRG